MNISNRFQQMMRFFLLSAKLLKARLCFFLLIRKSIAFLLLIGVFASTSSEVAAQSEYYYYCPKSDVLLGGSDTDLDGRGSTAFPKHFQNEKLEPLAYSNYLAWSFSDCSDSKFFCKDARDYSGKSIRKLVVPRKIEIGKEYHFGDVRALIMGSTTLKSDSVQIILWQKSKGNGTGNETAIKLTFRAGYGVTFIDGVNFWNHDDFVNGETCALQSKMGYFWQAKLVQQTLSAPVPE